MGPTTLSPRATLLTSANQPMRTLSGLNQYAGTWGINEVTHLLKRTMFGAAVADINYFKTRTVSQAVDELVNSSFALTSQPVNDYNDADFTDPTVAPGQTWINAPNLDGGNQYRRIYSFKKWHIGQMINQGRSIELKMMLFLHNHFATQITDINNGQMFYNHHQMLRSAATGNIKALTKAITTDAVMLQYLSGQYNTAEAPNENYARELQELFCIGKGPDAAFTEEDVREAARVLTGWKVNYDTNSSFFYLPDHDTGNKSFSSFYNNTTIAGQSNAQAGVTELDSLLNMLFNHSECALFLCRKLYRWFVHYEIDAATEANVIAPLAQLMRSSNYELKPVLKALLKSEHFFDVVNQGAQIKSPIDFMNGLFREFKVQFPAATDYAANYEFWGIIHWFTYIINQQYGDPPNVAGWPAYYQAPQYYEMWINASSYPKRIDFSHWMVDYGIDAAGTNIHVDVIAFARLTSAPANPNTLITDSLNLLYRVPVSDASKAILKTNTLLDGQQTDAYWTSAWIEYINDPGNEVKKSVVEIRLKNLYRFLVNSPEYQLA